MTVGRFALLALFGVACSQSLDNPVGPHDLTVNASVSAVTLADSCEALSPPSGSTCSTSSNCLPACTQSNMTLELDAAAGNGSVPVEIVTVRVLDGSGNTAFTLSPTNPAEWNGSAYVLWDQSLPASTSLKIEYDLSGQTWTSTDTLARATTYRVEVDLRIDGAQRTIALDGVTREPPANT